MNETLTVLGDVLLRDQRGRSQRVDGADEGPRADHVGGRAQRYFRTEDAEDVGRYQPMPFEPDAEGFKFIFFFFALA